MKIEREPAALSGDSINQLAGHQKEIAAAINGGRAMLIRTWGERRGIRSRDGVRSILRCGRTNYPQVGVRLPRRNPRTLQGEAKGEEYSETEDETDQL
jgi:hypothetical protein